MYLNEVTFAGFLGKDAETFATAGGVDIVTLSICHTYKGKDNKETVTWVKCKVFAPWSTSAKNLKKGDNVYIKGSLRENKWTDKESGKERSSLELTANAVGVFQRDAKTVSSSSKNLSQQFDEFGKDPLPF